MIETQRLLLRGFELSDLDDLFSILSDPQVARYTGNGQPASLEQTRTALLSIIAHWKRHGYGRWAIVDQSNQLIGYGGLRSLFETPEVVYHLGSRHWGKGLATEMAHAALRFGFEERHFERIVAIAMPANVASIRVMQKIGMQYEMHTCYFDIHVVQYGIHREQFLIGTTPYRLLLG